MTKDLEIARVNLQLQAEHVARLLDMAVRAPGGPAQRQEIEARLELVEAMLWKHHRRIARLKEQAA